jgi:GNAT superfamily N-acetyltransferase
MDAEPHPSGHAVEQLALEGPELADAASVAAAAFADDPFFVFLSPNERIRRRGLFIYSKGLLASLGERGRVFGVRGAAGRLQGVAAFVIPGGYPLPVSAQLRQLGAAFWALAPRPPALVSGSRYLLAIDRAHPKGHLWYLALLVVHPDAQRGGIGGALQEHVYRDADRDQIPSYLETQKEANLAYYRRFGYELVQELHPVRQGPPLWTMRREPKTPDA